MNNWINIFILTSLHNKWRVPGQEAAERSILPGTCVRPSTGSKGVLVQEGLGEALPLLSSAEEGAAGGHPRQSKTENVPEQFHLSFLRNLSRANLALGLAGPQTDLPGRESASAWSPCVTDQSPRWPYREGGTEPIPCPTGTPTMLALAASTAPRAC